MKLGPQLSCWSLSLTAVDEGPENTFTEDLPAVLSEPNVGQSVDEWIHGVVHGHDVGHQKMHRAEPLTAVAGQADDENQPEGKPIATWLVPTQLLLNRRYRASHTSPWLGSEGLKGAGWVPAVSLLTSPLAGCLLAGWLVVK